MDHGRIKVGTIIMRIWRLVSRLAGPAKRIALEDPMLRYAGARVLDQSWTS